MKAFDLEAAKRGAAVCTRKVTGKGQAYFINKLL